MVLPSFKVGFSIIPESSPSNPPPQHSDDPNSTSRSYLPSTTQQQHSWTNDPSRSVSASIITPSSSSPQSQQISRPTISCIPINLIPGDAPAFGLRRRTITQHSSIENQQNPSYSFQNGKRPNSPTIHAGAYKRPRGHSICSGSTSYVRLPSQTSSDLIHSLIPSSVPLQISSKNIPTTNHPSSLSNQPNRRSSIDNPSSIQQKDHKQHQNNTFRSTNPQLPYLQNPIPSSSLSPDIRIPVSNQTSTPPKPLHPSTSDVQRSNIPRTSNLISFAPLSLSHRSGGSKQQSHGFQGSLLNADYIEDSTCRLPVDVLGSPRQSLNSVATARTTHALGNSAVLSNPRPQTTSDWSNIYPNRTNNASNPQNAIVDGTDTLNRERNHYNTQVNPNRSSDPLQPVLSNKAEVAHTNISTEYNLRVTDQQNIPISRSVNSLPRVSITPSIPNTSASVDSAKPIPLPKHSILSTSSLPIASASTTLPLGSHRSIPPSLFSGSTTFAQTSSQPQIHQQAFVAPQPSMVVPHSRAIPQSTSFPIAKGDQTSVKPNVQCLPSSSIPPTTSSPFPVQTSSTVSKYMTIPTSSSNQILPASSTTLPKHPNENQNVIPLHSIKRTYQNPSHGAGPSQSPDAYSKPLNADTASRPLGKDFWGRNTGASPGIPLPGGAGSSSTLPYGYSEFSGPTSTLTGMPEPSIRPSPSSSYGNVYRSSTSTWIPSMGMSGDNRIMDERPVAMTPTNQRTQGIMEAQPALSQQNPGQSSGTSPRNSAVPIVARRIPGSVTQQRPNDEQGSVQCPHCSRKLRNQVTLHNHIRVVHDHSGNFQCPQCVRTFMWKSTLGIHMRLVHEKQRPHACEECDKAFRWKSHLREHQSVEHKGERPFKCPTCGKAFGRKNNMQKHMRKHNDNQ